MAVVEMDFCSRSLGMATRLNLILPLPRAGAQPPKGVLYLLHGMGDDYAAWLKKTGAERYAMAAGLNVVMPDGALSCYENMVHGEKYEDYIARELPEMLSARFGLAPARADCFIAGCSMGGFGALKLALKQPERFSAIGCFSAAHMEFRPPSPRIQRRLLRVYDGKIDECDALVVQNARRAAACGCAPRIYQSWGDRDYLRENALKTRAFFESFAGDPFRLTAEELPGAHDWALWDVQLARFIEWLGLPTPGGRLL